MDEAHHVCLLWIVLFQGLLCFIKHGISLFIRGNSKKSVFENGATVSTEWIGETLTEVFLKSQSQKCILTIKKKMFLFKSPNIGELESISQLKKIIKC